MAFTLSVQTVPKTFKNATFTVVVDLLLTKSGAGECRDYRNPIVFNRKAVVFRPHGNEKPAFSYFILKETRFCDGLECTESQTVEITLRFQIPQQ